MAKEKQAFIKGLEPKRDPKIHKLAENYIELRDLRMATLTKEVGVKTNLIEAMKEKALQFYEYDGIRIEMESKDKIKVKRRGEEDEGEEAE